VIRNPASKSSESLNALQRALLAQGRQGKTNSRVNSVSLIVVKTISRSFVALTQYEKLQWSPHSGLHIIIQCLINYAIIAFFMLIASLYVQCYLLTNV
jgi:hypothetical protein